MNQSSELLDILSDISQEERMSDEISAELEELKNKVKPNTKRDLYRFKDQATELLQLEIIKKDNLFKGRYENRLQNDSLLIKAIDLLKPNTNKY